MEEKYIFSIIVPVYNVESYLERCMKSLLCQENTEIILVDDGSTDASGILCDKYAQNNQQVRVFHKKNGGLSSARNFGILQARGIYLVFVDSDDYISEQTSRVLGQIYDRFPQSDVIAYGAVEVNENNISEIINLPPEQVMEYSGKEYLLYSYKNRNMSVQVWMYACRRTFLMENHLQFKEGILHEDVEFTPRMLLEARQVISIPEKLYYYIVRKDSISTQKDKTKNIQDLFSTLEEQCCLAEEQEPQLRKWMLDSILNSYLNMIQEAQMYRREYRDLVNKSFLKGKAVTRWNHMRVILCTISVRLYCWANDFYKKCRV